MWAARGLIALLLLALSSGLVAVTVAQQDVDLRITGVDTTSFPEVTVRVLLVGPESTSIIDLSQLVVRENGVPIPNATVARIPAGIDVVFVLDANPDILLDDDNSGRTRRDKVAAALGRFAAGMDANGLDSVSIIVPDESGTGATFLLTDASQPADVTAALDGYDPLPPAVTPLNEMLSAALDHLGSRPDSDRFQAVMLLTDGARLDRQLDYPALVQQALENGTPVFTTLLGAQADPNEVDNVARLYQPTGGRYVHMPQPEDLDSLLADWRTLSDQALVSYESLARQSGEQQVAVSLGNVRDTAAFDVTLAPPVASLELQESSILREGSAPDTPLELLQPATQTVHLAVDWPEGRRGEVTALTFLVNDRPQVLPGDVRPDPDGRIPLRWDISGLDTGSYRLVAQIADDLGFSAQTDPLEVTIETRRPVPPTPTVVPTRDLLAAVPIPAEVTSQPYWLLLPVLLLLMLILLWLWRRRRRARQRRVIEFAAPPPVPLPEPDKYTPILDRLAAGGETEERLELPDDDATLGRDPEHVDLVLSDSSVSPLHARIRRHADETFWLYDEGSDGGTFLNHNRLALAPRQLQHGDLIQLGRVAMRFSLVLVDDTRPPAASVTQPEAELPPGEGDTGPETG